jgi:hypothetical protein
MGGYTDTQTAKLSHKPPCIFLNKLIGLKMDLRIIGWGGCSIKFVENS